MIDLISLDPDQRQFRNPRIALVTARDALELDEDMPLLVEALQEAGVAPETPYWDDPSVDWARYGAALLRSTWDYADRIAEFLAWCDRCAAETRLLNHPQVVRWNTDKHYLVDLARAGVPVAPTRFVEPGCEARAELATFLGGGASSLTVGDPDEFNEFVVKPAIGAGSRDAARYRRSESGRALEHVHRLLAAGRGLLLQPYLSRVDEHGETAVLYLGGEFSHAIRKGPLLRSGAAMVEGLFAPEEIRPRQADRSELEIAAAAYAAIPFAAPAYARIDLLRDARGAPVVLELELTEPSLFLAHAPGAAVPFARHLVQRLGCSRDEA
jgi:glutathione synthase/RimK-type ligase-like ATP-grasp enzyme